MVADGRRERNVKSWPLEDGGIHSAFVFRFVPSGGDDDCRWSVEKVESWPLESVDSGLFPPFLFSASCTEVERSG
jgi:hypothetical protein